MVTRRSRFRLGWLAPLGLAAALAIAAVWPLAAEAAPVELNIKALAESRRQRAAISTALGSRKRGGLLVLASASGSASAKAGLRPDDVVILAGATPVRGLRQLRTLTQKAATTPLTVLRRGAQVQMVFRGVLEGIEVVEVPALK